MNNMPFRDDEQPFYADESESLIFRVKDLKKLIEDKTQLTLIDLVSMGSSSNAALKELYNDLAPERAWFVLATFQTLEGVKTAEIFVTLKDRQLQIPRKVFLHLITFLFSNRNQAKRDIPDLTLDYIETLEGVVSDTWRAWRDISYYLHRHKDDPSVQRMMQVFKPQMDRLYKSLQDVNFLGVNEEKIDSFSTGF